MALEVDPAIAVLLMALVTFATRLAGVVIMQWMPGHPRLEAFLQALSGSVLVALVVPMVLRSDFGAMAAVGLALAVMLASRNAALALVAALAAAVLLRSLT